MVVTSGASKKQELLSCDQPSSSCPPPLLGHSDNTGLREKSWLTFPDARGEPLLPGLPNEVTLAHVTPKLGWRDFYVLAAVSPAWCHAIPSCQVYDARVVALSTETLILFSYQPSKFSTSVALYSTTKNTCIELPPIPTDESGIPLSCKCVALNGKIYIWGMDLDSSDQNVSYVFDLAGQRQWQSFKRRGQVRDWFGFECAVLDSKIHALGGLGKSDPV